MNKPIKGVLIYLILTNFALADDVNNSHELSTAVQNTTITNSQIGTSQDWGLSNDEWNQYMKLMQGVNGFWYPHLTPPEVLGLNAQNFTDEQHFAQIVAKEEHDKLARELTFDSAVHSAFVNLYTNEPVIKPFNLSPFNPVNGDKQNSNVTLQAGDHIALFIDTTKGIDLLAVPKLLAFIKLNTDIVLDIYCMGNVDDGQLRQWASFNQIPVGFVSTGRITLNHDYGKLQKLGLQAQLPYVVLIRNGNSQEIDIRELQ